VGRFEDRQHPFSGHRAASVVGVGQHDPERSLSKPWLNQCRLAVLFPATVTESGLMLHAGRSYKHPHDIGNLQWM